MCEGKSSIIDYMSHILVLLLGILQKINICLGRLSLAKCVKFPLGEVSYINK